MQNKDVLCSGRKFLSVCKASFFIFIRGYAMTNTLYEPQFEHDACGIGAVVNIDGKQTHTIVDNALSIVEKLEHRAGKDAAGETGRSTTALRWFFSFSGGLTFSF